ncbi:MAG: host attachment protein [Sphingobium sp.]|nr:host attachment protein [Sphingobium sp.]
MRIDHDALVMVADGGKMLLFRNEGDADYPDLRVEEAVENANPKDREQRTDAPGRAYSSVGTMRSAMGETDFHELQEDRFAADAVDLLNRRALDNAFERLIIVAPPAVLGEMRKLYNKALGARLVGEIARDLTGHHPPEIERAISGY